MKRAILLAAALAAALPAVPAFARPHDNGWHGERHGRWARGQRLPYEYRRSYVVSDYHRYRLRPPPHGYYYVRSGDDVLLTAIASGIISAVLGNAIDGGYRGSYYEEERIYGDRGYGHRGGRGYGERGYGERGYGGRGYGGRGYGESGVIQGPGGQTIYSNGPGGSSYTSQGPGGQTIVTEGPNGRTITRQGPGGQTIETVPYD